MAKAARLKVFRTAIGFHDAYVAAPSRKAALAAWGSDKDLFARGVAEEVSDPALSQEPLAHPGTVVRRLRGTVEEQIAALPPDTTRAKPPSAPPKPRSAPKRPRPSRAALDDAERALAEAERRHDDARDRLATEEARLAKERKAMRARQEEERTALEQRRDEAARLFSEAMRCWEDG